MSWSETVIVTLRMSRDNLKGIELTLFDVEINQVLSTNVTYIGTLIRTAVITHHCKEI